MDAAGDAQDKEQIVRAGSGDYLLGLDKQPPTIVGVPQGYRQSPGSGSVRVSDGNNDPDSVKTPRPREPPFNLDDGSVRRGLCLDDRRRQ